MQAGGFLTKSLLEDKPGPSNYNLNPTKMTKKSTKGGLIRERFRSRRHTADMVGPGQYEALTSFRMKRN